MGVTTNSKMKKANLVDLIYKNFKDHFKVMLKYILTVELKGNDNYHCYHSLTKLWVYKKALRFVCKIILQKQNTENLFQISPSRITFLLSFLYVKVSEMSEPFYKGTKSAFCASRCQKWTNLFTKVQSLVQMSSLVSITLTILIVKLSRGAYPTPV